MIECQRARYRKGIVDSSFFTRLSLPAALTCCALVLSSGPSRAEEEGPRAGCIDLYEDPLAQLLISGIASGAEGYEDMGVTEDRSLVTHHWFCPPRFRAVIPVFTNGVFVGLQIIKVRGSELTTETLAAADLVTNRFSDWHDPVGVGFLAGYKFSPWANNVAVAPFVSFDYLHASVNHTFANGSFLGTMANVGGTAGVKVGPQFGMGVWLYGIAGFSVLNETLNVNFIPVSSSRNANVTGPTVGAGVAWQPHFLQGFALPVSLFVEYQHTWWQDANFNAPAASPAFTYNFARQDDTIKFGFTVALGAPPPPAARPLIAK